MKKFLFTLAALLMAGSAFANPYLEIAPFEVPQSALGATGTAARINVDVKAHFDYYVSAWQAWFTLPEGLTIQGYRAGSDLTLSGYDDFGDPKTYTPNIKTQGDKTTFIVACDEAGYAEDGSYYGCMKWAPGDYDQMVIVVFNATADFKGGEITIKTDPACGADNRPGVETCPNGLTYTTEAIEVTVEGATPQPEALTADITIGDADGLFVPVTVTNVNDPEATIVVTANGTEYPIANGGITLPEYDTDYNVVVTVNAVGENYTGTVSENKDVHTGEAPVVTIPFDALAEVTVDENGLFTFVYEANDPDAVVTTTVGNEAVVLNFVNGVATYQVTESTVPGDYTVTATIKVEPNPEGNYVGEAVEDDATYTYHVDEPVLPEAAACNIQITPNAEGTAAVVTIENYTEYTIKVNGAVVDTRALPYTVNAQYDANTVIEVYAKNAPANYTAVDETKSLTLAPLPYMASDEAVVGETHRDANNVYVPVTGNVTKVTVDGDEVALVNGEIVLPRQDADYTPTIVIVTNDGEHHNDATVTINDITVPALLVAPEILVDTQKLTQWIDPDNDGVFEQVQGEVVTFTISTPYDGQVFYTIDGSEAIQYTGEAVPVEGNGTHTVTAYVVVNGEVTPVATKVITVNNDYTGVNEIANGKAVAGVRYFNMAGQEMTEANGVTIVVTTYTDGTTSAVKVMK